MNWMNEDSQLVYNGGAWKLGDCECNDLYVNIAFLKFILE